MKNSIAKRTHFEIAAGKVLKTCSLLLVTILISLASSPVLADEEPADKAEFGFEAYMWMSTLKLNTATGDKVVLTFGDVLKNLDFTLMLRGSVQKDRFYGLADVIYVGMSSSQRHDGEFLGQPISGKLEVGVKSWVLNFVGGYSLIDNDKNQFGLTAGARYLDLTLDTTTKIEDRKRKRSVSGDTWDGVVGFSGRHNYPDGHYFNYYADLGAGDSKMTWQALANFAYDYKKFTGIIGYRYLKWNFKNDSAIDDLTIHGPYLGAKWTW